MGVDDNRLMAMVDEKARLAGSNKMELLLFSLGGGEVFGINVFKVREVCETIPITKTPNVPPGVEGIISLRGAILPVIGTEIVLGTSLHDILNTLLILASLLLVALCNYGLLRHAAIRRRMIY